MALAVLAPMSGASRPLSGQTPVTALGLGVPVPPVDARAAALGGGGVGLLGGSFTIRNPADLVLFEDASLSVTAAPEGVDLESAGVEQETGRSRFPVIRAVLPLDGWAFSLGFGSELDQDWNLRFQDTLRTTTGSFPFEETRESDGGVSTIDVSMARRLGPFSVGVTYQRLTGNLRQTFRRRFEISLDSTVRAPVGVRELAEWDFGANRIRGGLGFQLGDRIRLGASYAWTDDLKAERDSLNITETFDMPVRAEAGGSVRLGDRLLVAATGGWTGWSDTDATLNASRARDVLWGGGGVEFGEFNLLFLPLSVRAGGRFAELPFALPDGDFLDETAVTFGVGAAFAGRRGSLDFGVELGSRGDAGDAGLEESFSRFTVTATLRQ